MRTITFAIALTLLAAPLTSFGLLWTSMNMADSDTLALYHFGEGSGTAAADSSGNGRHGTLTSDFYASEGSGHWLSSGSGTYLSGNSGAPGDYMNNVAVSGVDYDKGLSVSFWYRVRDEAGSPSSGAMLWIEGAGATPRAYLNTDTFGTSGNGRLSASASGSNSSLVEYGDDHIWRHIGLVYDAGGDSSDGGTWQMYLDNTAVGGSIADTDDLSGASSFDFRFMSNVFNTDGSSADYDELLIQNGVINDFSDGYLVPEPSSLILLLAGFGTVLVRRRMLRARGRSW